ncbi:LON peptidase substrate-binding domain-containing protein [Hyphomonas johnsonii]|nr:LON peptidase substrate-binding domain-containing protein [Hyphomonas johnsonii]
MTAAHYRKIDDLPATLAIFPLPGALLFPRWPLPLNIFEPRYLNMIDDAMAGSRLIGMVQAMGGDPQKPDVAEVGCAGRITTYAETDDGRYLITLTGIARFEIEQELDVTTPYRQVRPGWKRFADDLHAVQEIALPSREKLIAALHAYVEANQMQADWSAVEGAPMETLVNALCSGCPFSPIEKQALVEAPTLKARAETLITLLKMDVPGSDAGTMQ